MQTPGPFEYERARSVEGAIASLQRQIAVTTQSPP